MKFRALLLLLLFTAFPWLARAAISPGSVAVLYNASVPESRKLAELYRAARNIPEGNLIGLPMPTAADISREDFERSILKPLRNEFETRKWWQRRREGAAIIPSSNKIRVLVTMQGVPLRIQSAKVPQGTPPAPDPRNPAAGHDEASVDSELAMVGVEGLPTDGVLQNKFYKSDVSIIDADLPYLVLTARIDAPTLEICERMIGDAVEAEETGLWGRAYVDIANKFPQGDQWLEEVVKKNLETGIPTVVDRFNETLPVNYPMTDCSLYYGWYAWDLDGPFLNTRFNFRKGAVAMHLHSFSAQQLTDGTKNWSGGLLARGAAVTVGNVYEPYLHLTHDFGILHRKLLEGYTWGEACWMAMPVTSWQGVVLGDPLYRPFRCLSGNGVKRAEDIPFRALRAAAIEFAPNRADRLREVEKAAQRMKSGVLAEAVALEHLERKDTLRAAEMFRNSMGLYQDGPDKLRQDYQLIAMERASGQKEVAILHLKETRERYGDVPEAAGLKTWLDILDPPPPPPPPVPAEEKKASP
ncbi:MAG: TIGR03790 family protein [Verrucomicrobiota bacterium]